MNDLSSKTTQDASCMQPTNWQTHWVTCTRFTPKTRVPVSRFVQTPPQRNDASRECTGNYLAPTINMAYRYSPTTLSEGDRSLRSNWSGSFWPKYYKSQNAPGTCARDLMLNINIRFGLFRLTFYVPTQLIFSVSLIHSSTTQCLLKKIGRIKRWLVKAKMKIEN